MLKKFSQIIASIMIAALLQPTGLFAETKPLSIVVAPVVDKDSDEKSRELADTITGSLRATTPYHIVNTDLTAQVLEYYNDTPTSQAEPVGVKEAEDALSRAKEHFFAFRYEDANRELSKALSILEGINDLSQTGQNLVDAHISRALIAKSRGDTKAAHDALAMALRINPRLDLAKEEYPPSLLSIFGEERGKMSGGQLASIAVSTKPEAAEVYLNGVIQGATPALLANLPAGKYRLSIRTNKYDLIERDIDLSGGKRAEVSEKLRWTKFPKSAVKEIPENTSQEVREGLRIADTMKVDKVILVNAGVDKDGGETIGARMVDRQFGVGQPPLLLSSDEIKKSRAESLALLVNKLILQAGENIAANPGKKIDPKGIAKPVLLGHRKRNLTRNPYFWAAIGAIAAGAIAGGVLASMSGGGDNNGGIRIKFK